MIFNWINLIQLGGQFSDIPIQIELELSKNFKNQKIIFLIELINETI